MSFQADVFIQGIHHHDNGYHHALRAPAEEGEPQRRTQEFGTLVLGAPLRVGAVYRLTIAPVQEE